MSTLVLQLSDLHLFAEPDAVLRQVPTRDSLAEVLDAVRATGLEFDRAVVDLTPSRCTSGDERITRI